MLHPQVLYRRLLVCALIFLCAVEVLAQTTRDAAGWYMGREIAQTMHYSGAEWLTRESRQREEDCATMLKQLDVKKGDVVCDLGCGNGFYSIKLAKLVGSQGKVLGVDIQPQMLEMLKKRAAEAKVENVNPILATEDDPGLEEHSVDLVLMVDVYHELSKPAEVLAHVRKSLKPGGRVALVEFRAEDPNVPIKPLHKMRRDQIMKEWTANGFKLSDDFEKLPWQHLMFFQADDAATTQPAPQGANK